LKASDSAADEKVEKEKVRLAAPDMANQSSHARERFGEEVFSCTRETGFAETE
jgi:hypothetical protein